MIAIFKAIKMFFGGVLDIFVYAFIKNPVIGISVVALCLGWWIGDKHGVKDTLKKTDKQLFEIKRESRNLYLRDSISIAKLATENNSLYTISDSLKTALQQKENLRLEYEKANKLYVSQIKDLKGKMLIEQDKVKEAIDKGFIICDTLILERKQKLLSNKYYYVIIPKPDNLKELIRD